MPVLVDTNILARTANKEDKDHLTATQAVLALREAERDLVVARQSVYEFWVVATRPREKNGMGLSPPEVLAEIEKIESFFPLLAEPDGLYTAWKKLVSGFQVSGKPAHDARLVALMQTAGISEILSFNASDFSRYQRVGISVLDPHEIVRTGNIPSPPQSQM
jgi:predicted nucleic acid-binding protein